jgi:nucleotide-binding universal stress UspA family protein
MRVLTGVDGSAGSLAAVQFIGRLLSADQDEIRLYYSPPPVSVGNTADPSSMAAQLHDYLTSTVFDKAREHLPLPLRRTAKSITGSRDPRQGLLVAADECRADLLVVGAQGLRPAGSSALGSLARYVVHHASIPVLVVRDAPLSAGGPIKVLLASDGSPESRHAAEILVQFSWPAESSGRTITVLESATQRQLPEWLVEQMDEQQLAALGMGHFATNDREAASRREDMARGQTALPAIFQRMEPLIVVGHAGDEIVREIAADRTDLVVVGARRQGAVRRLLLGSTSEHVLAHAPCSVLVIRGHEQP